MKIIFLDMDGVLCTNRAHIAQGIVGMPNHGYMDALDREAIGMLNKFTNKYHDLLYVCSSTWRKFHSMFEMRDYLRSYGWVGEFHTDWKTDDIGPIRGNEIDRWLRHHPETDNYIILDDNSDMLEHQKYHFVQTDSYDGISSQNYWHMERIFNEGNLAR